MVKVLDSASEHLDRETIAWYETPNEPQSSTKFSQLIRKSVLTSHSWIEAGCTFRLAYKPNQSEFFNSIKFVTPWKINPFRNLKKWLFLALFSFFSGTWIRDRKCLMSNVYRVMEFCCTFDIFYNTHTLNNTKSEWCLLKSVCKIIAFFTLFPTQFLIYLFVYVE